MRNVTAVLTVLFLQVGASTIAQPGSLDSSFGGDGIVITDFGSYYCGGHSVAIQPDGKIVVAGHVASSTYEDFAVVRYEMDGTLDTSFGLDGRVSTSFGMGQNRAYSVGIDLDGKIVAVGIASDGSEYGFALVRYEPDGSLDTGFGVDGKVISTFGTQTTAYSTVIQPDRKVIVIGAILSGDYFAVARYGTNGSLDETFGTSGVLSTTFGMVNVYGYSVALQLDGKIVVVGAAQIEVNDLSRGVLVARYNSDGMLDESFGLNGLAFTDVDTGADSGHSVAIQPDGKIVVAGQRGGVSFGAPMTPLIVRYNADGTLDVDFGEDGIATFDPEVFGSWWSSIVIQPDGKIVVAGTEQTGPSYDFIVARYNADGTLDNSFGVGGRVHTDLGSNFEFAESMALQPDGQIVVAGMSETAPAFRNFAVVRYLSGLNIGVVEFSFAKSAPLIYPNPIAEHATLQYTLLNAETMTIELLDVQGKVVQTILAGNYQPAGEHRQAIDLPEALPAGTYLIAISSHKGRLTVQVVK